MVSYHPSLVTAIFWCFRNCGSGDMMFLVVEGQDSTCPSLNLLSLFFSPKHIACHAHAHETSRRRHKNLPVCPLKDIRFWSYMSRRTTDRNYFKNFCQSVQKQQREGKREETHGYTRFKQQHVESWSSTSKNIISPLPQCLWPPTWQGSDLP